MDALSPAPRSIATLAPSAMNLRTVSGVAATRVSPAARSCSTAIRTALPAGSGNQDDDDQHDHRNHRHDPFQCAGEAVVSVLGGLDVVGGTHRGLLSCVALAWLPRVYRCIPG